MTVRDVVWSRVSPEADAGRSAPRGVEGNGKLFEASLLEQLEAAAKDRPSPLGGAGQPSGITALVDQVDAAQQTADFEAEKLAAGGGNIHETAVAFEKAEIEMRLLMRGRDKVVQAYQEIMRMNV